MDTNPTLLKDLKRIKKMLIASNQSSLLLEPMPLEKGADGSYGIEFLQREYVSGQPVLLRYYASNAYSLAFAEPETDSLRIVKTLENGDSGETRWIDGAGVTQEGNVVAMCGDGSGYYNGTYGNREITVCSEWHGMFADENKYHVRIPLYSSFVLVWDPDKFVNSQLDELRKLLK